MRYPSSSHANYSFWLFILFVLTTMQGCKKEVTEVQIDAFANLNVDIKYTEGIYNISFTLQEYPYGEVNMRVGESKDLFHKNTEALLVQPANLISNGRYGAFLSGLSRGKTYFYQIVVKDSASSKHVYSDVFSFKTAL